MKRIIIYLVFLGCCIISVDVSSQNKIDSLEQLLLEEEDDSNQVILLIKIAKNVGEGGGYNKMGFVINFEDDSEYTGMLHVTMGASSNPFETSNVIGEHVKNYLNYQLTGVHDIGVVPFPGCYKRNEFF